MTTFDQTTQANPLADRKRWFRFALELAVVSAALLVLAAYFSKSLSPEAQREALLELRYEDLATRTFTKTDSLTLNEREVECGVKFSRLKVTLYTVQNGNMKTESIAKSEFDD